jgi:hypothetical protein
MQREIIFIEAAAHDAVGAVDIVQVHRDENGLHVDRNRAQQIFAQRAAELVEICAEVRVLDIKDLAHEGIAMGVDAARSKCDHNVSRTLAVEVEDLRAVDNTDGEASNVVVVGRHGAGAFGGLAADERAAGLHAAIGQSGEKSRHFLRLVIREAEVVEEEDWFSAAAEDVDEAHGDAVDPYGVGTFISCSIRWVARTPSAHETSTG